MVIGCLLMKAVYTESLDSVKQIFVLIFKPTIYPCRASSPGKVQNFPYEVTNNFTQQSTVQPATVLLATMVTNSVITDRMVCRQLHRIDQMSRSEEYHLGGLLA